MKKTTTLLLPGIVLLTLASFTACKKETVNVQKSNTELLTQKAWKYEIHGLDENNDGVIEQSETDMLPCESDDVFSFNTNGTGVYSSGELKCSVNDPSTVDFNWVFTNNETELTVFSFPEKVYNLDENVLETYYEDQNSMGQTVKYIRRFKH